MKRLGILVLLLCQSAAFASILDTQKTPAKPEYWTCTKGNSTAVVTVSNSMITNFTDDGTPCQVGPTRLDRGGGYNFQVSIGGGQWNASLQTISHELILNDTQSFKQIVLKCN